jgi:cell fate (sporulation/competence/biofilm development) regulator YlbF (YheA/YmcA/DUF963 family)
MDLKQVMKSFIALKEELDDVERQGLEYTAEETYEKQFLVSYKNMNRLFCQILKS